MYAGCDQSLKDRLVVGGTVKLASKTSGLFSFSYEQISMWYSIRFSNLRLSVQIYMVVSNEHVHSIHCWLQCCGEEN